MKLFFLVNYKSGNQAKEVLIGKIHSFCDDQNLVPEIFLFKERNTLQDVELALDHFAPHMAVAVGGDGTISMIIQLILKKKDIKLGIIPAGSANGMAKNLGIPDDVMGSLQILINGKDQHCDILKINDKHFCFHLGDIGFNAAIVKEFEKSGKRGYYGYVKSFFHEIFAAPEYRFSIKTEKVSERKTGAMLVMANAREYGNGARINPLGEIDDGLFEIVIVRKLGLGSLWGLLKPTLLEKYQPSDTIDIIKAEKAEIEIIKGNPDLQIDGEVIGKTKNIKIEMMPKAVTFLVPATL